MLKILETLQSPPPDVDVADINRVAKESYGVVGVPKSLGGERDQNFLITPTETGQQCVILKVANQAEPDDFLDLQCAALDHIAQHNSTLPIQLLVRTKSGKKWSTIQSGGLTFRVRALRYIPGVPLNEAPEDARLMRNLGRDLAKLNIALRGFFHPAARHAIAWDSQNLDQLVSLCDYLKDVPLRDLAVRCLDRFSAKVKPRLSGCRAQVIHNDVSFHNALIDPENPYEISGIFDFGDMLYAPLIQDLAVTAAEVPLGSKNYFGRVADIVAGFNEVTPLERQEFELLPDLIIGRLVIGLLIKGWSDQEVAWTDDREHLVGLEEKTLRVLRDGDAMLDGEFENLLLSACGLRPNFLSERSNFSVQESWDKRNKFLGNASQISYSEPVNLVKGEGVWLFDSNDKAYLDAYNNVPHVGHCHPRVVASIAKQTATLNTNTRYLYDALPAYAENITSTLPPELDTCFFVSSGSEANDLAWRLSKNWTSQTGGLVIENAYHGVTDAVFDLSPAEAIDGSTLKSHIEEIKAPDDYRGPWKRDDPDRGLHYAAYAGEAINKLMQKGHSPAAFFMDMIMSSSGIIAPLPLYTEEVYNRVKKAGGLFVADEVQSGFGRLGKAMWGFEMAGITPDIVTFGKPIAAGYPMGLVVTRKEIAEKFERHSEFFSTTGGNPVACVAANMVLQVIEDEELILNADRIGNLISDGIRKLSERHPVIGDVRGSGLFIGVELIKDTETLEPAALEAKSITEALRNEGVLIGVDGIHSNVLKIRPPMVINESNANFLLQTFQQVLENARR
ncbi:MAG: aminotransferase class III-fold pyridoxal phosphate-dependent enzyme [Proteobacteria bacterium]|nr:aminotransferase class III-fold pyridoxal phosphate-dependent enzyme [Pseudomonadota bacterium]